MFRHNASQLNELVKEARSARGLTDLPHGVVTQTNYGQLRVNPEAGDLMLCFSDAVTESQGSDGRQLEQALPLIDAIPPIKRPGGG